jgi:hypothetical protein
MDDDDDKSLRELLLESAKINIRLRKRFRRTQGDVPRHFFTYALLLGNDCVYVGGTNNIYMRLMEHVYETSMSSLWVREHGFIRVLEVVKNSSPDDELYKTMEYMTLFGWKSVRGSHWCKIDIRNPPPPLADFVRNRCDFDYMNRREIDDVLSLSKDLHAALRAADDAG